MKLLPTRPPAGIIDPIVRVLASAGVTPTMVTTAGLIGNVIAAVFIVRDELFVAGIVVLFASALDMFDGALARATGQASRFGALFDSVLDRMSEAVVLFALCWWAIDLGRREEALLAFAAVIGSILVSYVRARAEGLGLALRDGFFTRPERVILTGVMLLTGPIAGGEGVRIGLWLLAVLALFTTLQRLWIASRTLLAEDAAGEQR